MLFNSYYFIIYFLPLVLFGYYSLHKRNHHSMAMVFMIIASFFFYAFNSVYYLILLISSIICNWIVSKIIIKTKGKVFLFIGIIFNIIIIAYFKYFDFAVSNINILFNSEINVHNIMLPLGISFYTFQQISYLIDSYRGETENYNLLDYIAFVSFFPQLVAGPIVLHSELIPQFRNRDRWIFNYERFSEGLYFFTIGLFKKVMIADQFGKTVIWTWTDIYSRSSLELLLTMLFYTLQIYFDFSGYSDMAIGIAKMFNLDLPINFNSPYRAISITDFWKRWHMTLTRFLTKYIYIPLGGNKKGKYRTYLNILLVFLISGLWHGANWTFILWGILYGVLQIIERVFGKIIIKIPKCISWFTTFVIVNLLWVLFYAPNISDAFYVWKKIFSLDSLYINSELYNLFKREEIEVVLSMIGKMGSLSSKYSWWYMVIYVCIAFFICLFCKNLYEKKFVPTIRKAIILPIIALWSVLSLSGVSTFLYFNF